MFSGGDSTDDINSVNPLGSYGFINQMAVSKAVAAGQNIDWAHLAQQWIQMRDNTELEVKKAANAIKYEEKGEADMDMDDEEQADDKTTSRTNDDFATTSSVHNINQSWFIGEGNSQIVPASNINNQWNTWPNQEILAPASSNQSIINNGPTNSNVQIPSLLKMTVPHPNELQVMSDASNQADSDKIMDAAKRKGLPAWIREGLEKMEREKQKQLEKEQKTKSINLYNEDNKSNKDQLIKPNISANDLPAAIVEEESSDSEETLITTANAQVEVNLINNNEDDNASNSPTEVKTYDQKLTDLMIAVRRTLTELLLETTNEEISKVAEETIKIFKSKASSAQVVRKSALSTLTGKLGLAVYGDSSSENDSDNEDRNSSRQTTGQSASDNDSEEELRNVIRLKRRGFIKTSEEIEERIAFAAAREEEKLKYFLRKEEDERENNCKKRERSLVRDTASSGHSGNNICKGYEKDFGEITESKIQHLNGKRQRERTNRRERITRFSDNKDKYVTLPNAATYVANVNSATTNFGNGNNTIMAANSQRPNMPDINGLLPNYTNPGMTNVLNAADAALDKVLKSKASASPEKRSRRHEQRHSYNKSKKRRLNKRKNSRSLSKSSSSSSTSSSSSSTSSDSDSSTSRSSHHSKHKHLSAAKTHKSYKTAEKHYERSYKSRSGDRKSSSRSYEKRERESTHRRNRRKDSSDSEDEYRRRHRHNSHHTRKSSQTRSSYTSSRRARDRDHSRSQSRSSYSSSNRRH